MNKRLRRTIATRFAVYPELLSKCKKDRIRLKKNRPAAPQAQRDES